MKGNIWNNTVVIGNQVPLLGRKLLEKAELKQHVHLAKRGNSCTVNLTKGGLNPETYTGSVLWFHVGCPSFHPFICMSVFFNPLYTFSFYNNNFSIYQ